MTVAVDLAAVCAQFGLRSAVASVAPVVAHVRVIVVAVAARLAPVAADFPRVASNLPPILAQFPALARAYVATRVRPVRDDNEWRAQEQRGRQSGVKCWPSHLFIFFRFLKISS